MATIRDEVRDAAGNLIEVREYQAPLTPAPPVPEAVTETQFMRAAADLGVVTGAEAEAYLARGELPAFVVAAMNSLPEAERLDQRLKAIGSDRFRRDDGIFALLIASGAATAEKVDQLFILASSKD